MNINYSFIIPHKNCPELLQRCIDSIPERDDIQVIVVDDNSEEDKKPDLRSHKNLQVILLDATRSKGAGRARNVGLDHAIGKWLVFADSDDFFVTNLSELLDKYVNDSHDIIYFNVARGATMGKEDQQRRIYALGYGRQTDCHILQWQDAALSS